MPHLEDCLNTDIFLYNDFDRIFKSVIDAHAPSKTKFLRANNKPHITKDLRKAIMLRTRLKNIAAKTKLPEDMANYRKQRNLVVNLNRKSRSSFYHSITTQSQSKNFWKECKPLFSNKINTMAERILLVENERIVSDDRDVATTFNEYFNRITETLDIPAWGSTFVPKTDDPVRNAIAKYSNHPSICKIKGDFPCDEGFELQQVTLEEVSKEILSLESSKKVSGNIPVKILKLGVAQTAPILTKCFNSSIAECIFPDELKLADIIPIHKKDSTSDKKNYRPISLLPTISKVFERLIEKQLRRFFDKKLSKYLCGFRKGYSTQHSLLDLLNKWKRSLHNKGKIGAVLMDLSKAFDCLPHDLLIAKLKAYGVGTNSLKLIFSYLSNRKHRVRIGSSFSDWLNIIFGVPQGSILGPILFNIFINDLLSLIQDCDICNFADDNTLYACDDSIDSVLNRLNKDLGVALSWFKDNFMVANPAKFQVIFLGVNDDSLGLNINGTLVKGSEQVKLLGVTLDNKLSFLPHIKDMCIKSNKKTKALLRVRNYLSPFKAKILCNSFILSIFNYCPIIWMFSNKEGNKLINSTHSKALRAMLNNFSLNFEEMLEITGQKTIHQRNLEFWQLKYTNP